MTPMWPDPERLHKLVSRLLAECQRHSVNAIAGYDYLSYHLAAGVCSRSWPIYPIPALLIRDGQKGHGAKELVAGPRLEVDARVAVVLTDPKGLPIAMDRLRAVGYDPCVALNWEAMPAPTEPGPHRSTNVAHRGLAHQGHEVIQLLRNVIDLGGFTDLATDACRRFNEEAEASEAANEVFYQTYSSSEERGLIVVPLQASWDIIQQAEGANDGLVSRQSQRWTAQLHGSNGSTKTVPQHDFPLSADHFNEVGWWDFNQLRQVNLLQMTLFAAIKQYEASIQDVYREMAEEVRQLS